MRTNPEVFYAARAQDIALTGWREKYASAVQIVLYSLECELATVQHLAMLKRSPKRERERHAEIAQNILASLLALGFDPVEYSTRIKAIVTDHEGSVASWADDLRLSELAN